MAATPRMAAIAIGVADAKPLPYLQAAINGAKAFHAWATALGYDASLVTDETDAVTIDRLRSEFMTLLNGPPIDRFVIYFAGHGLIREAEEGLWLLSDWNTTLRAVASEVLKRRLYLYNVGQIAIFADACRVLADDIVVADLTPDAVLGRGPALADEAPSLDKFIAAQDSKSAFALPGSTPNDDVCIFSYALMEALWGLDPSAMSPAVAGKVTSSSLGAYLKTAVPAIAKRYNLKLFPNVSPTFPFGKDICFFPGDGAPPEPLNRLVLPDPTTLVAPSPGAKGLWSAPAAAAGEIDFGVDGATDDGDDGGGGGYAGAAPVEPFEVSPPSQILLDKMRAQTRPAGFETGSGFAIEGATVRAIWTPQGVSAEPRHEDNWWRLFDAHDTDGHLAQPAPCLIELDDASFVAASALPDFIATLLCDSRGAAALVYRPAHADPDAGVLSEDAISRLEDGAIRSDAVSELATALRQSNHANPVLGAICAYLYDAVGDLASIRAMAAFFANRGAPIPYDVALMAQLKGTLYNGALHVDIPAIAAPPPDRDGGWTATPASSGIVGGLWPWLRQGWAFLDDPADDGSTLVLPGVSELMGELKPGRFTTLTTAGGERLAELFGLAERRAEPEPLRPVPA